MQYMCRPNCTHDTILQLHSIIITISNAARWHFHSWCAHSQHFISFNINYLNTVINNKLIDRTMIELNTAWLSCAIARRWVKAERCKGSTTTRDCKTHTDMSRHLTLSQPTSSNTNAHERMHTIMSNNETHTNACTLSWATRTHAHYHEHYECMHTIMSNTNTCTLSWATLKGTRTHAHYHEQHWNAHERMHTIMSDIETHTNACTQSWERNKPINNRVNSLIGERV